MSELRELPQHDGAWGRDAIYDESVWTSAKEALDDVGCGLIICVETFSVGPKLWGFETYNEEKDEYTQRWFDNPHEAKKAFDENQARTPRRDSSIG